MVTRVVSRFTKAHRAVAEAKRARRHKRNRFCDGDRAGVVFRASARVRHAQRRIIILPPGAPEWNALVYVPPWKRSR